MEKIESTDSKNPLQMGGWVQGGCVMDTGAGEDYGERCALCEDRGTTHCTPEAIIIRC